MDGLWTGFPEIPVDNKLSKIDLYYAWFKNHKKRTVQSDQRPI